MKSIFALYIASMKEYYRSWMNVFWSLAFPILFIFLFGYIFSGNSQTNYTVGLVNQDTGQMGNQVSQAFSTDNLKKILTIKNGTKDDEINALKKGQVDMVIVIPPDLSQNAQKNVPTGIQLYYDESNQATAQIKLSIVQQVLGGINQGITKVNPPLTLSQQSINSSQLRYIDFLIPGILAMSIMQMGIFGTAMPLVALREQGVLKRLGTTPLPKWHHMASQLLMRLTTTFMQVAIIIGIGVLAFNIHIQSNLLIIAGWAVIGALMFVSLGYFIAAFCKTSEAANSVLGLLNFPMMFLSGIFFPINSIPGFLAPVVWIMPPTYLADAFRQVMVGGVPAFPLTTDFAVLAGWLLVCSVASTKLFKWE